MSMELIFKGCFDRTPIGLLLLDAQGCIFAWNHWLVDKTGISTEKAIGKRLDALFVNFTNPRFDWAFSQVLKNKSQQMLSQTLNHYLLPIPLFCTDNANTFMMQQQVYLSPIKENNKDFVLVSIIDVSKNVERSDMFERMMKKLHDDRNRDPLTGVYNRHVLDDWFEWQSSLSMHYAFSVSCLMIDLDNFKNINDKYGHDVGDRVLKDSAQLFYSVLRKHDLLVRYGGDEFLVFFLDCQFLLAVKLAERVRKLLTQASIADLSEGAVTCSIGVSHHDHLKPHLCKEIIKLADIQLYIAKKTRNEVQPSLRSFEEKYGH